MVVLTLHRHYEELVVTSVVVSTLEVASDYQGSRGAFSFPSAIPVG